MSFDIVAATEALLRVDFYRKVYKKDKSNVADEFRNIHRQKGNLISLENDIIETLKKFNPRKKKVLSDLVGLLKYRHWLAHGRYWRPKLGANYSVSISYSITEKVFALIK